jgi:CHAD domain-containing protein
LPQQLREFMITGTGDHNSDGDGATAWSRVADALRTRFQVATDASRTVRRVWLDTFDWSLYRADTTLEYISGPGVNELALVTRDGERIATAVPRTSWPRLVDQVPAGPVRELVAPLVGIRALLPVAVSTSAERTLRVLDAEDKTVARLTVDNAAAHGSAASPCQARLTITPVRGYYAQARRVERLLADLPGATTADRSAFHMALGAAGRHADDYSSHMDVALTPAMPARTAVATVLLRLLDIIEANIDGTVRDIDTEFLHDLRIAVRRTRAALKLAGDALPGDLAQRYAPEFRWLGQLTTPMRDLDVHLLGFAGSAAGLVTASPEDLAPMRDSLIRYRAAERRRLARGLRSGRFTSLTTQWRATLDKYAAPARKGAGGRAGQPPIADLAAARIQRAYRRLTRTGAAVTAASPEEDLHMVRKRGKELRYLLEFFAALHDPATHRSVVRELKQLQDCLGEIQDGHVQREAIRALATRMVAERAAPAATLLAMGELAAQLDAAASAAREDFGTRFARFTSGRNAERIASLTEATAA